MKRLTNWVLLDGIPYALTQADRRRTTQINLVGRLPGKEARRLFKSVNEQAFVSVQVGDRIGVGWFDSAEANGLKNRKRDVEVRIHLVVPGGLKTMRDRIRQLERRHR